jgi:hypothetical protein
MGEVRIIIKGFDGKSLGRCNVINEDPKIIPLESSTIINNVIQR